MGASTILPWSRRSTSLGSGDRRGGLPSEGAPRDEPWEGGQQHPVQRSVDETPPQEIPHERQAMRTGGGRLGQDPLHQHEPTQRPEQQGRGETASKRRTHRKADPRHVQTREAADQHEVDEVVHRVG